ncbi:MAG: hypothetical protein C4330_12320 [Chitinophagaceae bacterium]
MAYLRTFWLFFVLALCLLVKSRQYYLKGQVKNDKNIGLQNVIIKLQPTNNIYFTGPDGYFGIVSSKPTATASFYVDGYDTTQTALYVNESNTIMLKQDAFLVSKSRQHLFSITNQIKPFSVDQWIANETYSSTIENDFVPTAKYLAIEVGLSYNSASYSNISRFLNQKDIVPSDAVRIEEMLNYFNWHYQKPETENTFRLSSALTTCPWNKESKLLFVQVHAKKVNCHHLTPNHFVFLIDASGSMDLPNRLPLLKLTFEVLLNNLSEKDTVSIVVYGGSTRVVVEGMAGSEKERIRNKIDSLQAYGCTPGSSGIKTAYQLARKHFIKSGKNRIILATDGDFNVGVSSEEELEKLITKEKQQVICLT